MTTLNHLLELEDLDQSVWLDYIDRDMLRNGGLAALIAHDGLGGLTSNPAIFEKAIARGGAYTAQIADLARGGADREQRYERLVLDDIGAAADQFRGVYDRSGGADGYVSIEVSPMLARDTEGTVTEARSLWRKLGRPNVMIKVPGTREGLPAIRTLIGDGINVNITLLFSVGRYLQVVDAWMDGLEDRGARGQPLDRIASVASFFISRIDVAVDAELDALARDQPANADDCRALRGQAAIASAAFAYKRFRETIADARWRQLAAAGARVQRLLWASTGVKDPGYSDLKYVEPLIAPNTVTTLPPDTLAAYREHGNPALRIDRSIDAAAGILHGLTELGIDLHRIDDRLEVEGIDKFMKPYQKLLATLEQLDSTGAT